MLSQFSCLFLAFQNNANQTAPTDPNQSLNAWLVIAGLLIIFFCLLTVFLPNIKVFITKPQEFNLSKLGVSMKVSILTVFVLMGFILSLSSFVLQWRNYVQQVRENGQEIIKLKGTIADLNDQIRRKEDEEIRARTFSMSILLKPKMEKNELLSTDEWSCTYWLDKSGKPSEPVHANIDLAKNGTFLRVFLNDITSDTRLYRIELKKGNQSWTADGINPLTEGTWEAEPFAGGVHEN
jgi:hypothetical protein